MKKIFVFLLLSAFADNALSATFKCQTFLNLDVISTQIIETKTSQKVSVDDTDVAVSYLTEKSDGSFSLEAFLPLSEIRIYSDAAVSATGQSITVSAWTREYMVDVVCRKLN